MADWITKLGVLITAAGVVLAALDTAFFPIVSTNFPAALTLNGAGLLVLLVLSLVIYRERPQAEKQLVPLIEDKLARKFAEEKQKLEDNAADRKRRLFNLNQVYKEWRDAHIDVGEFGIGVYVTKYPPEPDPPFTVSVEKIEHFGRALEYLKEKHRESYDKWNDVIALVEKYNNLMAEAMVSLEQFVRSQMKSSYPKLSEHTSKIEADYYHLSNVVWAFRVLTNSLIPNAVEWQTELEKKKDSYSWILRCGAQPLIYSKDELDADPARIMKIFEQIKVHQQIARASEDLTLIYAQAHYKLKDLCKQINDLWEKIEFGEET